MGTSSGLFSYRNCTRDTASFLNERERNEEDICMIPVFFKQRGRRTSLAVSLLGGVVVLSLLLAACGSGGTITPPTGSNPTTSTIAPPTDLITPGVLTVGSDTTYPPQEYIDTTTNKAAGFDVDLITAIAQRMGLQAKIVT